MANNLKNDIIHIKEWMKKEPQLPDPFDDEVTVLFLHSTYYSLEQTKKCIDRFSTNRHLNSMAQIYVQRDPLSPDLKLASSTDYSTFYRCKGKDVFYYKITPDANKFNLLASIKVTSMKIDYIIQHIHRIADSHAIVIDLENITMKYLPKLNPVLLRDFLLYLLESMPVRIKKIFIINAPAVTDFIYNMVKPVLPANIIEIIEFSTDFKCLHTFLDRKELPADYGGEAICLEESSNELYSAVLKQRKMFLDDELWKGDASKIPKKVDMNAMNGSFRSLAID